MVPRIKYDDYINENTINLYCNTNEKLLNDVRVNAILIELPGLGGSSCLGGSIEMCDYETCYTSDLAKHGIVVAYVFPGPWSWGNRASVRLADSVVAALSRKYKLGENFKLGVCGGSMGGLGSLIYAADSSYHISAVAAACPCTNALTNFSAFPDLPRTFLSSVAGYDMDPSEGLKTISPLYRIDDLQRTHYFICSDEKDEFFREEECDNFVEMMKNRSLDVIYYRQPGYGHGGFASEVRQKFHEFLVYHLTSKKIDKTL